VIAVEFTIEESSPTFAEMAQRLEPHRLLNVMGRAATNLVREHLFDRNKENPNKMGGERTGYYASAARATHFDVSGDGVTISINQVGIALHYYGGTVTPGAHASSFSGKPTQYLTIPARAEAYGHRASEFSDLIVLWGKNGPYALARAVSTAISFVRPRNFKAGDALKAGHYLTVKSRGEQGGEIMFWLVKKATIQPDPDVLPSAEEFEAAMSDAVSELLSTLSERAQEQS